MARADAPAAPPSIVRVAVAFSPSRGRAFEVALELPAPATALAAIHASGVLERHPELAHGEPMLGIWGRACAPDTPIGDGDRIELYRPLVMEPNEARRLRARNRPARGGR